MEIDMFSIIEFQAIPGRPSMLYRLLPARQLKD
jgi:hypothetical protein